MFTNNWYKILTSVMLAKSSEVLALNAVNFKGTSTDICFRTSDLTNCIYLKVSCGTVLTGTGFSTSNCGVRFGDGTNPVTINDYNLAGNAITTISVSGAPVTTIDEDGTSMTTLYTVSNTGSEDVTIGEIGLFGKWSTANDSYSYNSYLLERTVLDTPVTIPAGGIGQVTYTIRMNYPTA